MLSVICGCKLTIFYFLDISWLYKVWFDILKPPEELCNEHHDIRLKQKKRKITPHINKTLLNYPHLIEKYIFYYVSYL